MMLKSPITYIHAIVPNAGLPNKTKSTCKSHYSKRTYTSYGSRTNSYCGNSVIHVHDSVHCIQMSLTSSGMLTKKGPEQFIKHYDNIMQTFGRIAIWNNEWNQ